MDHSAVFVVAVVFAAIAWLAVAVQVISDWLYHRRRK